MMRRPEAALAAAALLVAASCTPRPPTSAPAQGAHRPRAAPGAAAAPDRSPRRSPAPTGRSPWSRRSPRDRRSGSSIPTITFSKPVVALGTVDGGPRPARRRPAIEPAVAGEWRWLGSASVEFVPARPLPDGTRFTVTVPAGLRAVDGSVLAEPYSFSFETRRPAVLGGGAARRLGLADAGVALLDRLRPPGGRPGPAPLAAGGRGGDPAPGRRARSRSPRRSARPGAAAGRSRRPTPGSRTGGRATSSRRRGRSPSTSPVQLSLGRGPRAARRGRSRSATGAAWNFRTHGPMVIRARPGLRRGRSLPVRSTPGEDDATRPSRGRSGAG